MIVKSNIIAEKFNRFYFSKKNNTENELSASYTHYLHNRNIIESNAYRDCVLEYIKKINNIGSSQNPISNKVAEEALQYISCEFKSAVPFPAHKKYQFKFIDLFAGIGGIRLAFQNLKGKCVFSSEWDKFSKLTYEANFGEVPFGDITKPEVKNYIPNGFDVLCAGFPCQSFSIAGKRGGFEDTRGTLFFDVAEIIKQKQPKAFFLENVKGLKSHDKGNTLRTILNTLRNDLNYYVPEPKIINAKDFGVPQNRERIFIVGFRKDLEIDSFKYPKELNKEVKLSDVLEKDEVSVKYYLSTTYLETLRKHKARHINKGNGFGYEILSNDGIANAVVCGGMGRERNLIVDNKLTNFVPVTKITGKVNREGVRKMTPREWARLQGFPDNFKIVVSDAQAYKQFGNSVAIPAIQATAELIIRKLIG